MRKFILTIGVLLFCINSISQDIQHEVTVTLKLVQVFVTDKQGNPVRGLKVDDFSLFVDGDQETITDFETHFTPSVQIESPEESSPQVPPEQEKKFQRKYFLICSKIASSKSFNYKTSSGTCIISSLYNIITFQVF